MKIQKTDIAAVAAPSAGSSFHADGRKYAYIQQNPADAAAQQRSTQANAVMNWE